MTLSDILPKPHYPTRIEKLVDGWLHGVALALFIAAACTAFGLAIWQGGISMAGAIAVYAVCLVAMIACSMAYNMSENVEHRLVLRRFDHAAIFLMIAGSYTPFTTQRFQGGWAIGFTTLIWVLALGGMAGKLIFPRIPKAIWVGFYVFMGWLALTTLGQMTKSVPTVGIVLLLIGGALYSLGVPFYLWERLPFRRAIWHGFVMAAAGVHYAAILTGVVFS